MRAHRPGEGLGRALLDGFAGGRGWNGCPGERVELGKDAGHGGGLAGRSSFGTCSVSGRGGPASGSGPVGPFGGSGRNEGVVGSGWLRKVFSFSLEGRRRG